jgi:hypothetical protein
MPAATTTTLTSATIATSLRLDRAIACVSHCDGQIASPVATADPVGGKATWSPDRARRERNGATTEDEIDAGPRAVGGLRLHGADLGRVPLLQPAA